MHPSRGSDVCRGVGVSKCSAVLRWSSAVIDSECVQDNGEDHVMLFMDSATEGGNFTLSLARQGVNAYQYRIQFTDSEGVTYAHTATDNFPVREGDVKTVLFRFQAENYEIHVEEVIDTSTGDRYDVTGDSSSFEIQVCSLYKTVEIYRDFLVVLRLHIIGGPCSDSCVLWLPLFRSASCQVPQSPPLSQLMYSCSTLF